VDWIVEVAKVLLNGEDGNGAVEEGRSKAKWRSFLRPLPDLFRDSDPYLKNRGWAASRWPVRSGAKRPGRGLRGGSCEPPLH